jgi:hypothetical protein
MTGIYRATIPKPLVDLGAACSEYQNNTLVNLACRKIQVDENLSAKLSLLGALALAPGSSKTPVRAKLAGTNGQPKRSERERQAISQP